VTTRSTLEGARVLEVVVARLDLAVVDRHQFDIRPGVGDRGPRLLELDAFDAVRRQDRDLLPGELIAHE
jgi:hypothetical protein